MGKYCDPAPGGGTFYGFFDPAINGIGDTAFVASTSGRSGMFIFSDGQVRLLFGIFDPAPGGGYFTSFAAPSLNDAGQLAFLGAVAFPGRSGIFRLAQGAIQTIAQTGDLAPGGGTFDFPELSSNFAPSLNASGQVAFGVALSTGGRGVFLYSDGTISSVVRPGDPAPGGGTIVFADSASSNDAGEIAFPAQVMPRGRGLYLASAGTLSKIAEPGDPAPGGGFLADVNSPKLNSQTQVTFFAFLIDGLGAILGTPIRKISRSGDEADLRGARHDSAL